MRTIRSCSIRGLLAFLVGAISPAIAHAGEAIAHEMSIVLDPAARQLSVKDRIRVSARREFALRLDARFKFEHLVVDGNPVSPKPERRGDGELWRIDVRAAKDRDIDIEAQYSGQLDELNSGLDHRQVLGLSEPVAGPQGAFVPGSTLWFLHDDRHLIRYRARILVPDGYRALVPGEVIGEAMTPDGFSAQFESKVPLAGVDLLAGPYEVNERELELPSKKRIRIRTYFHSGLADLASGYLDAAASFLARYDREIGPYAFDTYSIVSSPLPTGFGMPGIAYLGRQVLRLPFIRARSLGHEVLHDWWGNGVFPDYERGNWSEGLTTFLADYAYQEDAGVVAAQAMRRAWLRDLAAVRAEQDRPLSHFVSRRHDVDQVVGYDKAAFVFYMLREIVGEASFREALQKIWLEYRLRVASWDDLRRVFEATAHRDLGVFFSQWIDRTGAPRIEIVSAKTQRRAAEQHLTLELRQDPPAYTLALPLRIELENGSRDDRTVVVQHARQRVELSLSHRPTSVVVDPDVHLLRRLDANEIEPIFRQVFLDERTLLARPDRDPATQGAALVLAAAVLGRSPGDWAQSAVEPAKPLLIIGLDAAIDDFLARHSLAPVPEPLRRRGTALAYASHSAAGLPYVVISARDVKSLAALARALPHLGANSFVIFEASKTIERGIWPAPLNGIAVTD